LKANPANLHCGTGTCGAGDEAQCCENDATKCSGIGGISCASGKYRDYSKNGAAATASDKNDVCCTAQATCDTHTCGAGMLKKATPANIKCASGTCGSADEATCCTDDATKCKGIGNSFCAIGQYKDPTKAGNPATATDKYTQCCTKTATCPSDFNCPAGKKRKTTECSAGDSSCNANTCCEIDKARCYSKTGGLIPTCGANRFEASPNCCVAKATCTGYDQCDPGTKPKANPGDLYCSSATCGGSDKTTCCEDDATKCKGIGGVTCASGSYQDPAKNGDAATASDKNTVCCTAHTCGSIGGISCASGNYRDHTKDGAAATASDKNTVCCKAKATCDGYACNAAGGRKLKANPANLHCGTDTCGAGDETQCCEDDATKCSGIGGISCASDKYRDSSKNGAAATASDKNTVCCTAKATCDGYACDAAAGRKLKANPANLHCGTGTCGAGDEAQCCENDATKCSGIGGISCASGKYRDYSKNGAAATASDKNDVCCTAQATCDTHTCGAGMLKKATPANIKCASGTCGSADEATCCTDDATKCKGIGNSFCAIGQYKDPTKAGNPATATDKYTQCCTKTATCPSDFNCPAGKKRKTTECSAGDSSCNANTCCEIDKARCYSKTGGLIPTCGANRFEASPNCCVAKATCTGYDQCDPGTKPKANPGDLYCSSATCGGSDKTTCCEDDATKCKGIGGVTCASGSYQDPAKNGDAATASDKNTVCCTAHTCGSIGGISCASGNYRDHTKDGAAATASDKNTVCCKAKATCDGYACNAAGGRKLKANPANLHCGTDTCGAGDETQCCEDDATKCKGIGGISCAGTFYRDSSKDGNPATSSDKNTACCTEKGTCDTHTCGAGMKLKASPATLRCNSNTCGAGDESICCEDDPNKCKGIASISCATGKYKSSENWNLAATANDKNTVCCAPLATCEAVYGSGSGGGGGGSGSGSGSGTAGGKGSVSGAPRHAASVLTVANLAIFCIALYSF